MPEKEEKSENSNASSSLIMEIEKAKNLLKIICKVTQIRCKLIS